jgi:glycosyltransferase involved in cell wall biosynthesis
VSKSSYSSHDDSDDARKDIPREKIDLNVDYEEGGKNAKLVFRVISVYPSDLIQLSLRYDKFDKYEDGENVVIDTSYTIDPSLDPKDIKNLNVLARSVFVEMAPLELEWETDDLDMECATIVFEAKIIEDGTDVNDEDIPWSMRTVLVDITEQPELCQVFDSLKASRIGAGSCTEKRKEVRQIRPKREYAEFVEKTDRERREIVSEFIEDSAIGALPFVSVVVPFYNGAKETLEETLSSVYSQTYKNIEVLLIDDGSKDGSSEVARQLVDRFNQKGGRLFQIQVHEKQNGGLGDARNFGFDRAIGKYVLPLDADDLIDETFIEKAIDLLEDPNNDYNLAVADLVGFGDWEYSWNLPKYDPQDLRYFNAFHCSAVILKSLWDNTPGGYPRTTLFGYEDWAFWLEAEKYVGLKPVNIREPLFKYRLRKGSMLQSMIDGKNELFALASVRMLNPITYPVELILSAHDMFNERDVTREIVDTLTAKLTKFQRAAMPALMLGIYFESNGKFPQAGQMYLRAIEITDGTNDWQPRWRNGLLLQKVGNYDAANVTLSKLFKDFDGLEQVYEEKRKRTPSMFGAILAPSVVEKRRNLRMENNNSDNNVNKSSKKYTGGGGANKNDEL